MDLQLVNPQAKYPKVTLLQPPPLGYIHLAAAVGPLSGRTPFPGRSPKKAGLLTRLGFLACEVERLAMVERATVYRAVLFAPPAGAASQAPRLARHDVVVLIETTSPQVLGEVQATEPYNVLAAAVTQAATDVHVMTAHCRKRVGDVDKTRQGLFLFNYFVADDAAVALQLWEHLAGWYVVETGLDNSTLLEPLGPAAYAFVNHARWDSSLPRLMLRQLTKPSFRTYILANLQANRTIAMPILYQLAAPPAPQARSR
jgi:hypothetical protein